MKNKRYLDVRQLSKSFELDNKELVVLDKLSFQLDEGDFLTVLGPSGCGKSTLLRCIAGLDTATSGDIVVAGQVINKTGPDRLMVFQDFNQLFQWKNVLENVKYALHITNPILSKEEIKTRALRSVEMVHLEKFIKAYPNQLSGGMRQRVAIARALAIRPKVLLMDEPFGALDAQTRAILQKELLNIWLETKITIIFITHNIQESILLGNKIIVLSQSPASIKVYHENNLEIPRFPETPLFMELWNILYKNLEVKRF